jgi:hypothetical protein
MRKIAKFSVLTLLTLTASYALQNINKKQQENMEIIFFQHNQANELNATDTHNMYDDKYINDEAQNKLYSFYSIENIYLASNALRGMGELKNSLSPLKEQVDNIVLSPYIGMITEYNNWSKFSKKELLPDSQKKLLKIEKKIINNYKNKIIFHLALALSPDQTNQQEKFRIENGTLNNSDYFDGVESKLKGLLTITANKNIDFKAEINILNKGKIDYFSAKRRMKKNQLNYIDDERYGMLVLVSST